MLFFFQSFKDARVTRQNQNTISNSSSRTTFNLAIWQLTSMTCACNKLRKRWRKCASSSCLTTNCRNGVLTIASPTSQLESSQTTKTSEWKVVLWIQEKYVTCVSMNLADIFTFVHLHLYLCFFQTYAPLPSFPSSRCATNCMDKYLKMTQRVSQRLQEHQAVQMEAMQQAAAAAGGS